MPNVATVDFLDPQAPTQLSASLEKTGFAVLSNHPIAPELLKALYQEWEDFFQSPTKQNYRADPAVQAGFFPMGSENAKDSALKDLKEFYHYYPWWDQNPLDQLQTTLAYYEQVHALATTLLQWIEAHTPEVIRKKFSQSLSSMVQDSPRTLFRAIHYPPLDDHTPPGAVRAAAHEDINIITLLPAATHPGLQVQDREGHWHEVSCDPGTIVVNIGDMLQEATDGYYPSTTHRVVNPEGEDKKSGRMSMPLFLHARPEVRISKRYTSKQYLTERLTELGLI